MKFIVVVAVFLSVKRGVKITKDENVQSEKGLVNVSVRKVSVV